MSNGRQALTRILVFAPHIARLASLTAPAFSARGFSKSPLWDPGHLLGTADGRIRALATKYLRPTYTPKVCNIIALNT